MLINIIYQFSVIGFYINCNSDQLQNKKIDKLKKIKSISVLFGKCQCLFIKILKCSEY